MIKTKNAASEQAYRKSNERTQVDYVSFRQSTARLELHAFALLKISCVRGLQQLLSIIEDSEPNACSHIGIRYLGKLIKK